MTVGDLQDTILSRLVRQSGGTRRHWRLVLGPITTYDPATHPHCNWHVSPTGTAVENMLIEQMLDEIRGDHPIVAV